MKLASDTNITGLLVVSVVFVANAVSIAGAGHDVSTRPNIVVILADDIYH